MKVMGAVIIFLFIVLVISIFAAISTNHTIFWLKKSYLRLKNIFPEYYAQREETIGKFTKGINASTIDRAIFWVVKISAIIFAIAAAFFLLLFLLGI